MWGVICGAAASGERDRVGWAEAEADPGCRGGHRGDLRGRMSGKAE